MRNSVMPAAWLLLVLCTGNCGSSLDDGQEGQDPFRKESTAWRAVPERLLERRMPFILVGIPGNRARAWFSGDGTVQAGPGAPGIHVWLYDLEQAEAVHPGGEGTKASFREGYLPIPKIRWPGFGGVEVEAELTALLSGDGLLQSGRNTFYYMRIRLFNPGSAGRRVKLLIGITPFGLDGTMADYSRVSLSGATVNADGRPVLLLSRRPDFFGTSAAERPPDGRALEFNAVIPPRDADAPGPPAPMAVCAFDLDLRAASGEFAHAISVAELDLVFPAVPGSPFPGPDRILDRYLKTRIYWLEDSGLCKPSFQVPHRSFSDAFRGAVTTLLLAWEGAAGGEESIRRNYDLKLYDICMASVALNRAGQFVAARGLLEQLLARQEADGAFQDGGDGGLSLGGQGLALFALKDHYRFTGDPVWLETVRIPVRSGAERLARLAGDMSNRGGLYAEELWAIHGLESAFTLASAMDDPGLAERLQNLAEDMAGILKDSIRKITEDNHPPYIPEGSGGQLAPENLLGLTALLWPNEFLDRRSRLVQKSFDHYWEHYFASGDGGFEHGEVFLPAGVEMAWPFIILRRPKKVFEILGWLLAHPVIPGIHAWPEIWPAARAGPDSGPGRLMPSVRAAAAYIVAFRMLYVHEREGALVLAQCIPEDWFDFMEALEVKDLPTPFGPLAYTLKVRKRESELVLDTSAAPPGGFLLPALMQSYEPELEIDGKSIHGDLNFSRRQELSIPPGTLSVKVLW